MEIIGKTLFAIIILYLLLYNLLHINVYRRIRERDKEFWEKEKHPLPISIFYWHDFYLLQRYNQLKDVTTKKRAKLVRDIWLFQTKIAWYGIPLVLLLGFVNLIILILN